MKHVRFVLGMSCALMAVTAGARPEYNVAMRNRYKPPAKSTLGTAGCSVCHVGDSLKLNVYGQDLKRAMAATKSTKVTPKVLARVENLDSDKDGVKNGVELRSGSLPGDPRVKPAARKHNLGRSKAKATKATSHRGKPTYHR